MLPAGAAPHMAREEPSPGVAKSHSQAARGRGEDQ
jgi:hypothetical protein